MFFNEVYSHEQSVELSCHTNAQLNQAHRNSDLDL